MNGVAERVERAALVQQRAVHGADRDRQRRRPGGPARQLHASFPCRASRRIVDN
jgi:hypothetical protein